MALTKQQQLFVDEYISDLNFDGALDRSGYKPSKTKDGFYVYFLVDPLNDQIFYVGKGKKNRVSKHVKDAVKFSSCNGAKDDRIVDILKAGEKVIEVIFCDGLTERNAFNVERNLIGALKRHGLTNIASGTVSSEEANVLKASAMLKSMKSYDYWISTSTEGTLQLVSRVWGSPRIFYDWYISRLENIMKNPSNVLFNK